MIVWQRKVKTHLNEQTGRVTACRLTNKKLQQTSQMTDDEFKVEIRWTQSLSLEANIVSCSNGL